MKEESLLLLSDLQKLINQVVLIDYTIIILGGVINCDISQAPGKKNGWCDVIITVKDNGIGMSDQFLKHIYEPFERERNSTISRVEGSGIGMGIVKRLVELMDGLSLIHI